MEKREKQEAKKVMVELMQAGYHWQEAAKQVGIEAGRSTAYSWWQKYREAGESGLIDSRHGHVAKVNEPVLKWIEETCKQNPCISSSDLQKGLQEELRVTVSISHLNQTRGVHGWTNQTRSQEKKTDCDQADWQEGAGGLLLVAAAHETGLLEQLEAKMPVLPENVSGAKPIDPNEQSQMSPVGQGGERALVNVPGESGELTELSHPKISKSQRSRLLTLLLMGAYGLYRPRDLRSYTGDALGLLAGRKRAYGYWSLERFLTDLSSNDGADRLTTILGKWTAQLWQASELPEDNFYVDGHHKPVYTEQLIPRGLIGRTGKILGCRALILLHDQQGHPRLALTDRGDWHVMDGLQEIVARYEHITGQTSRRRIVVDREGMGATFLKRLADDGRFVVTLLRANQYEGVESFTQVGAFGPLSHDSHGILTREVAAAGFALPLPEQPGHQLPVRVALIRDLRRSKVSVESDLGWEDLDWDQDNWQAHPISHGNMEPRLIPIVTTDPGPLDAVKLARTYIHRWSAQENVIKDYLLPLGLDTNHGFAKKPVLNSEVAKKREAFQKQLETTRTWMTSARAKYHQIVNSKIRLLERMERYDQQYHLLDTSQNDLRKESIDYDKRYSKLQKNKDQLLIQQKKGKERVQKLSHQISEEKEKCERYAHKQCELLQSLEDLAMNERTMYELDNRKDQVMTVFTVAMANLAMWTRNQYFPDTYSNATWESLAPFFRIPGVVRSTLQDVEVSLLPFNDRQYNRDLYLLCQRVNQKQPHLPDGRLLQFSLAARSRPVLDKQRVLIA